MQLTLKKYSTKKYMTKRKIADTIISMKEDLKNVLILELIPFGTIILNLAGGIMKENSILVI